MVFFAELQQHSPPLPDVWVFIDMVAAAGRGAFATRRYTKGQLVTEYQGRIKLYTDARAGLFDTSHVR
jgi:hypothetical protein